MPFNAAVVGRTFGPVDWTLTPRRALAYRAALRPHDAAGLDDLAEGAAALPMQVVSPEWLLALMMRGAEGQSLTAEEGARAVHAGQDSRFHAPLRLGLPLKARARITGARTSRAGAVASVLYTLHDAESGALVAKSLSTTVYRGVALEGPEVFDEAVEAQPELAADAPSRSVSTGAGLPHVYSECAEIWNPIHTERRAALAAGLEDIIIHGTALWALAGLEACEALSRPPERLTRLAARFSAPAYPGETLALRSQATALGARFELMGRAGRVLSGQAEFG